MLLEAVDVHKAYTTSNDHSELEVLKGINLKIEEGDVVSLVGPSGAGKSTLLHILGGLDKPTKGTVKLGQRHIYKLGDSKRARLRNQKIGFVFQFYHLMPEFTALENVMMPAIIQNAKVSMRDQEKEAQEILGMVGLSDRAHHRPNQLSGGEQQRIAIARALINHPKIVLCDEPTGNLDSQSGEEIINLLMSFNKKNKQTLMIVTHDESIAEKSNRILHIHDGEIA